jgi:hypothetical protein
VQAVLSGYCTTNLINFISSNKAYSIFPRLTFLRHMLIPLGKMTCNIGKTISHYRREGWKIPMTIGDADYNQELQQPYRLRKQVITNSSRTWILNLDTTGVCHPSSPDNILNYCWFKVNTPGPLLRQRIDFLGSKPYSITARLFRSNALQYSYTTDGLMEGFWNYAQRTLKKNTHVHLYDLGEDECKRLTGKSLARKDSNWDESIFPKPKEWDYHDDELPGLWEQWTKESRRA